MKSLIKSVALAVVGLAFVASSASAAGTIGLYFQQDGNVSRHYAQPSETFKVYVAVKSLETTMDAVEYKVNLPANVIVLGREFTSDNAVNVGNTAQGTAVGIGECRPVVSGSAYEVYVVETITCMTMGSFAVDDITLTKFEGGGNDSNPSITGPRFSDCNSIQTFTNVENAQLSSSVSAESSSWGEVKAGTSE